MKRKKNGQPEIFVITDLIFCFKWALHGDDARLPGPLQGHQKAVSQGIEAFQLGEWDKAEKLFIDAQLDRPDMPELYYNIGSAAYKKGDYESAMANFTKAMDTEDPVLKEKATL